MLLVLMVELKAIQKVDTRIYKNANKYKHKSHDKSGFHSYFGPTTSDKQKFSQAHLEGDASVKVPQ